MSKWTSLALPRVEKVILWQESRGQGTSEDPCRRVLCVSYVDGQLVAENDPTVQSGELVARVQRAEKLLNRILSDPGLSKENVNAVERFFDPRPL